MRAKEACAALCAAAMLFVCAYQAKAVSLSAHSAVLIEADSRDVIFEKNAKARLPMASTTKIMTALVAVEHSEPDETVKVSPEACGVEGSSIYLVPGEELAMEELLYAMLLESANDAAAAIAIHIAGDIDAFADMMNETARALSLEDTHFSNPHGLYADDHYTTAYDLAILTAHALENESIAKIVATRKYTIPTGDGEGVRVLVNHNRLLRMSDDVIGVKTGFTKKSGRCLVSAAERDGVRVIAVTLNAPDDWNDHLAMHSLGFDAYESYTLAESGKFSVTVPAAGADDGILTLANRDALSLTLPRGKEITHVIEAPHIIISPVNEGDVLGRIVFYADGQEAAVLPLYACESTEKIEKNGLLDKLFR